MEEAGEGHLQPVERSNGASPGRDPLLGRSIKDPPRMYSDWMFIIRRVTGKKKQRTKGSSGPKLSEGKREQILLPHDMLIRKTTIHKVLIQLGNVKSSEFQDENLFLFLLVRPTILVVIWGSIDDILSKWKLHREYSMTHQFSEFNHHLATSIQCFSISWTHKKPTFWAGHTNVKSKWYVAIWKGPHKSCQNFVIYIICG